MVWMRTSSLKALFALCPPVFLKHQASSFSRQLWGKNDYLTVLSTSLYIFKTAYYFIGEKVSCYLYLYFVLLGKSDMCLI